MPIIRKRKPSWLSSDEEEHREKEQEKPQKKAGETKPAKGGGAQAQSQVTPLSYKDATKKRSSLNSPNSQTVAGKKKSILKRADSQPVQTRSYRTPTDTVVNIDEPAETEVEENEKTAKKQKKEKVKMLEPWEVNVPYLRSTWRMQLIEGDRYIYTEPLGTATAPSTWNRVKYSPKGTEFISNFINVRKHKILGDGRTAEILGKFRQCKLCGVFLTVGTTQMNHHLKNVCGKWQEEIQNEEIMVSSHADEREIVCEAFVDYIGRSSRNFSISEDEGLANVVNKCIAVSLARGRHVDAAKLLPSRQILSKRLVKKSKWMQKDIAEKFKGLIERKCFNIGVDYGQHSNECKGLDVCFLTNPDFRPRSLRFFCGRRMEVSFSRYWSQKSGIRKTQQRPNLARLSRSDGRLRSETGDVHDYGRYGG